ncbi:T9SS type A sorting domain-containing protein [Ekhidna sp.]|uniref:T9SS type A sorting domain-containing protein n=1 Tax=Ekhidna sp. TaxID=2608089 RepID=UPI003C7C58A2
MKTKLTILTLVASLFVCGGALAQSYEEGKIVVEITRDVNGEKKTFKGEYHSTEEMRADPNYQEFAGEEGGFNFWFDNEMDEDAFLHLDQLKNQSHSFFKYFHGDDEDDGSGFFFKQFDDDSLDGFFNFHMDNMDMDAFKERMKNLSKEMETMMGHFYEKDGDRHVKVIKRIKITDVDDEFGKKGRVDDDHVLELEDLSFYPNPSSNGRFKVRFQVPDENELTIKVSNLQGKEVFSRYFERFGGFYSETIDLSGQEDGIYLLEICQGKKRLTKKIVIN